MNKLQIYTVFLALTATAISSANDISGLYAYNDQFQEEEPGVTAIMNALGGYLEDDYQKVEKEITTDDGSFNLVREYRGEIVVDKKLPTNKDKVFEAVEQMPRFPGGDAELMEYINKNIVYPELAAKQRIQGRVVVKFVVKSDGSIGDIVIVRSKDPDLDKEAVRVVKSLPAFIPGRMNGQSVNVWYTLPVNFKLAEGSFSSAGGAVSH